ncbi:MAG TPA: Co2+/Mg2+ efflux protein ApaG [Parvularcula sp.]|nr:Co2+/Mg2+ efflux protein ApaG [Parvularcula sp.]
MARTSYERTTNGIRVSVKPTYLDRQSDPADGLFVWSYTVRIHNGSDESVRLRTRHWLITNARGMTEEVKGVGVVGEQPLIKPGEGYEYTSGAPLSTPSGMMVGRYGMETIDGEHFEVDIPAFSLDSPHERRLVN